MTMPTFTGVLTPAKWQALRGRRIVLRACLGSVAGQLAVRLIGPAGLNWPRNTTVLIASVDLG
jgi:hypothetical protein